MKLGILGALLATTISAQSYEILPYPMPELKSIGDTQAFKTILDPWQGMQFEDNVDMLAAIKGQLNEQKIEQAVLRSDIDHLDRSGYKPFLASSQVIAHRLKDVEVRTMEALIVEAEQFKAILNPAIYAELDGTILSVETSYYKTLTAPKLVNTHGFDQYFAKVSYVEVSFVINYELVDDKVTPVFSEVVFKRTVKELEVEENGKPVGFIKELGSSSSAGG
jgi:hypothetical protein